jgi:hypothetical protein
VDIILAFENSRLFSGNVVMGSPPSGAVCGGRLVPGVMAQGSPAALLELWNGGGPGCGCLGRGAKTWGGGGAQHQS